MKKTLCLLGALLSLSTARLTAQTFYDAGFGTNGIARLDNVDAFNGVDITLQDDHKILVLLNGNCGHGFLCRLNTDGSLDQSFTPSRPFRTYPVYLPGVIEMQGYACNPNMSAIRQLSSRKILLSISPGGILQFNSDGTLDTLFGNIGIPGYASILDWNDPASIRNLMDIKEQPGRGVLFAGSTFPPPHSDSLSLARMLYNGSLDRSFGNGGYIKVAMPSAQTGNYSTINCIRFLSNNKVLVAGSALSLQAPAKRDIFLALYDLNGQPDLSFGTNGVRIIDVSNGAYDEVWDISVDSNTNSISPNPFYILGASGDTRFIAKLDANGNLMTQYGTNGFNYFPHLSYNGNGYSFSTLSANGYLFTTLDTGAAKLHTYTCYEPTGAINARYPVRGRFTSTDNDRIVKMIGQRDGKILALGTNGLHPRVHRFVAYEPDKPTSIATINAVTVEISPNPFSNVIQISLSKPEDVRFVLVNSIGAVVYDQQVNAGTMSMPMPALPAGMYFYKVADKAHSWIQQGKLVKQ